MTGCCQFTNFPSSQKREHIFVQKLKGVLLLHGPLPIIHCFQTSIKPLYSLVKARWSSVSYHHFYVWEFFFHALFRNCLLLWLFPNGKINATKWELQMSALMDQLQKRAHASPPPKDGAILCGPQLFLHSKAVLCSQPPSFWSFSRNPPLPWWCYCLGSGRRVQNHKQMDSDTTQHTRNLLNRHCHQDSQPGTIPSGWIRKGTLT